MDHENCGFYLIENDDDRFVVGTHNNLEEGDARALLHDGRFFQIYLFVAIETSDVGEIDTMFRAIRSQGLGRRMKLQELTARHDIVVTDTPIDLVIRRMQGAGASSALTGLVSTLLPLLGGSGAKGLPNDVLSSALLQLAVRLISGRS